MTGERIVEGLSDAVVAARTAGEVALIIQQSREEDATATRTAYRILGHLGIIRYHEPAPPAPQPGSEPAEVAG